MYFTRVSEMFRSRTLDRLNRLKLQIMTAGNSRGSVPAVKWTFEVHFSEWAKLRTAWSRKLYITGRDGIFEFWPVKKLARCRVRTCELGKTPLAPTRPLWGDVSECQEWQIGSLVVVAFSLITCISCSDMNINELEIRNNHNSFPCMLGER